MLKKTILMLGLGLILSTGSLRAQSIDQLIEQLSLDIQKLSELKTILNELYTSYTVINKGYQDIRDIAEGNFKLHKNFLDGLLAISANVQHYYRVESIIKGGAAIASEYKAAYTRAMASGQFSSGELDHFSREYSGLFNGSLAGLEELTMVLTPNQLRMSDAERMAAIDRIQDDMIGRLAALRRFNNGVELQALQRQREGSNINVLKQLYGNPD